VFAFVCLFVCLQDNSQSCARIFVIFFWNGGTYEEQQLIRFGGDPYRDADTGIKKEIFLPQQDGT